MVMHSRAALAALSTAAILALPSIAHATLVGPTFPAPGGTTFNATGTSSGSPGGRTFNYSAILVSAFGQLYWGAGAPVTVSLVPGASNTLSFDPSASSPAAGIVRYTAVGVPYNNPTPGQPSGPLRVRLTLTQVSPPPAPSAWVAAPGDLPFPPAGQVINVLQTGSAFSINLLFEAEFPPGSNNLQPVNNLAQPSSGITQTSFNGGFYFPATGSPASTPVTLWLLALVLPAAALFAARRARSLAS